jgi:alpha-ketoglutarate-dependent taurine dioxygenase
MTVDTQLDIRPALAASSERRSLASTSRARSGTRVIAEVRRALNTHHVIFFRDQELTPDPTGRLRPQFGTVTEGHPVITPIDEHPDVLAIDGSVDRASWWHTDVTFLQAPAFGSILYMLECSRGWGRHHLGQPAGRL